MAGMAVTGLRRSRCRRGAAPGRSTRCSRSRDGELFIGVTSDQQWTRFVEEFGLQEVAADPRLATNLMRKPERSWLIPILKETLGKLPQAEVAQRCERAQCFLGSRRAAGRPVRRCAPAGERRAARRLHLAHRRRGRPQGRRCRHCRSSSGDASARACARQPPRMGEHNAQVLAEAGLSPREIAALAEARVIVAAA